MERDDELPAFTFEALKGETVEVRANGFSYRGVLVGADEGELYLRGEMRWVVLPLADVSEVRLARPDRSALGGWRPAQSPAASDGGEDE